MVKIQNRHAHIWVLDDNPSDLSVLFTYLKDAGFKTFVFLKGSDVLTKLEEDRPDLILLDIRMPEMNGFEVCRHIKDNPEWNKIPIIFLTAMSDLAEKIKAFNHGAVDYITKPLQYEEVVARVNTHLNLRRLQIESLEQREKIKRQHHDLTTQNHTIKNLRKTLDDIQQQGYNTNGIIGKSTAIKRVLGLIQSSANTDASVLITGETGTGKELVARALHDNSSRKNKRFVALNCSAIPENLIESELFGHEKGAFTDASKQKIGRFEYADGGTLFLDEIGDLPYNLQAKLLRVIQEKTVVRLGSNKPISIDVRVISATHQSLGQLIKQNQFREDLFYRLNVIPIFIPPLRERQEDIILLAMHFIHRFNEIYSKDVHRISASFAQYLLNQDWKGNVRELENTIERYVVLCQSTVLDPKEQIDDPQTNQQALELSYDYSLPLRENVETYERAVISDTLKRNYGNLKESAEELMVDTKTLYRRMHKYDLDKKQFLPAK